MIFAGSDRPTGVTILAILLITLGIIEGITGLLLGIAYAQPYLSSIVTSLVGVPAIFTFVLPMLAVVWMTFAFFSFICAYAVWTGRRWSWVASLVFTTNALTVAGFGLLIGSFANLIPLAVIALVLIALATPNVRGYLNRPAPLPPAYVIPPVPVAPYPRPAYAPAAYPPQMAVRPTPTPAPYPGTLPATCPNCGAPCYPGASFCTSCQARLR